MANKITRDAFLYLDPAAPKADEQCGTCYLWIKGDRCYIHGPHTKVTAGMSCGFYLYGEPLSRNIKPAGLVTPEQSGLVDRKVRCENCEYGSPQSRCGLYEMLNKKMPDTFALDTKIDPRGCCNAQTPKERQLRMPKVG